MLAEEAAGLRVLRSLAGLGIDLIGVVTTPAAVGALSSIDDVARRAGLPVWRPAETRQPDFGDRLRDIGVDVLLNVHSLHILDASIIEAPKIGSFNLHPGPLPQMAGLNAPSWAIYLAHQQHAVTLHWMKPGIDTGPIVFSEQFALDETDTGLSVSNTCVKLGVPLIESLLDIAARDPGSIPAHSQDLSRRRIFRRNERPNNGRIDWSGNAARICAHVRASDYGPFQSPWGHPKTCLGELEFEVIKASVTDGICDSAPGTIACSPGVGVTVATCDRPILLQSVRRDGEPVKVEDFLKQGDVLN